mmetsp:Transcript_26263/g.56391  ORF Transcript_26263/g.56391 Transcript_26263/m.56391 type:complete len:140 (-) Transcript_26263:1130-1549(-)
MHVPHWQPCSRMQHQNFLCLFSMATKADEGAGSLAAGLARNSMLKELNFGGNPGITDIGWQAIFAVLQHPGCKLEKLSLKRNSINDAAALSLNALSNNNTLKTLNLGMNYDITIAGWRALFEILQSPTCMLEDLDLSNN